MQNTVTTIFASASASVVLLSPQTSRSGRHAAQFVKKFNSFPIELGRKNRTARILVVFSGVKAFFFAAESILYHSRGIINRGKNKLFLPGRRECVRAVLVPGGTRHTNSAKTVVTWCPVPRGTSNQFCIRRPYYRI
jgi:hypothetical protein